MWPPEVNRGHFAFPWVILRSPYGESWHGNCETNRSFPKSWSDTRACCWSASLCNREEARVDVSRWARRAEICSYDGLHIGTVAYPWRHSSWQEMPKKFEAITKNSKWRLELVDVRRDIGIIRDIHCQMTMIDWLLFNGPSTQWRWGIKTIRAFLPILEYIPRKFYFPCLMLWRGVVPSKHLTTSFQCKHRTHYQSLAQILS